jgi:hypothetical protein
MCCYYTPDLSEEAGSATTIEDPGDDLPPMRLRIPLQDYIIDTSNDATTATITTSCASRRSSLSSASIR